MEKLQPYQQALKKLEQRGTRGYAPRNVLIYYFSGTGNSLRAGKWFASKSTEKGMNTSIIPIDRKKRARIPNYEGRTLIGFIFPTHGFTIIWSMLMAIIHFPWCRKKEQAFEKGLSEMGTKGFAPRDVFIISSVGGLKFASFFVPGFPGTALLLPHIILKIKGYRIVGTLAIDMPANWTALVPPQKNKKHIDFLVNRCGRMTDEFAEKILNNQKSYYPWYLLPLCIITIPLSIAYLGIGRFFLAKLFFPSWKCNGCRICQEKCPVDAIRMIGRKPYWTFRCESCQRCINFCPNNAIQVSLLYVVLLVWMAHFSSFNGWLTSGMESILTGFLGKYTQVGVFGIWYLSVIFFLFIAYGLFSILARFKPINMLLTYTSITKYCGRYREPGTKVQDFGNEKPKTVNRFD